jgi:hypothetical protein
MIFFVDGRHGAWSSLELSMVIAKDRHADRATRLEKALDDEASADRTELEQGIAPMGVNFIKASMKRSTGYGVCSLQRNFYSHLFLLCIITVITTIGMEPLMKLCESIWYTESLV